MAQETQTALDKLLGTTVICPAADGLPEIELRQPHSHKVLSVFESIGDLIQVKAKRSGRKNPKKDDFGIEEANELMTELLRLCVVRVGKLELGDGEMISAEHASKIVLMQVNKRKAGVAWFEAQKMCSPFKAGSSDQSNVDSVKVAAKAGAKVGAKAGAGASAKAGAAAPTPRQVAKGANGYVKEMIEDRPSI